MRVTGEKSTGTRMLFTYPKLALCIALRCADIAFCDAAFDRFAQNARDRKSLPVRAFCRSADPARL
jgi:hypothetical protein